MQRFARISAALSRAQGNEGKANMEFRCVARCHTVIGLVAFNKAPAVDVNHLALLAIVAPQHIESAHHLPEALADLGCP